TLGIGLKEAKDLVESAPCTLLYNVDYETAAALFDALAELGATVQMVPVGEADPADPSGTWMTTVWNATSNASLAGVLRDELGLTLSDAIALISSIPAVVLCGVSYEDFSVAVSEDGRVFISDPVNHAIRYLKDGRVYTLKKGDGVVARPVEPNGIFISGDSLYAADGVGDILKYSIKDKVFSDVSDSSWYAEGTAESVRLGLIAGTSKTTFSPEAPTTRAMFVTMLARFQSSLDGTTRIDGDTSFTDMTEETWWSASARWAADAGIVKGMPDGAFAPDQPITRQQMATMLYRYAEYLGLSTDVSADLSSFPDSGEVSGWALEGMQFAVGSGLIEGSGGSLLPAKDATRAQTVTVFLRLLALAEGE
ncbi:MAG: ribosomal protein L7/L12, partial [Oscillospiraceae bacterium]|nr:ribosomal protein L7/L12 [Oscillospiraceae bacterium]